MKKIATIVVFLAIFSATVAQAERLAVSSDVANIRSGPGTSYEILWKVEKYHPILVIQKSDSWYFFQDFEGDKGWVHMSVVGNIKTIITKVENNNVRSGPGTGYDVLFSVEKGIPFKILTRKDDWIHVEHADGDRGWIHSSLVW